MLRKFLLPLFAILGALIALGVVFWSQRTTPPPPILFPPPQSPYNYFIAASGIVEASSDNIAIGTPFNEVITKMFVTEGDYVKKGDPIFELDLRALEANLTAAKASLEAAIIARDSAKVQFSFYLRLRDKRAVSEEAYEQAHYNYLEAEENVKVSEAKVKEVQVDIERSTVRAPVDGQILQVSGHVGEIAPIIPFTSSQSTWLTAASGSIVLMGVVNPLQVRIDIDEDDLWRYTKGACATAFVRGNSSIHFPLQFVRVEPYVIPKSSFTGETVERVDTRVLQVLYHFERGDLPVFAGQILDIFIKSKPIETFLRNDPFAPCP